MKRTIVISAVNIRKGGTLTMLRECLTYLSGLAQDWNVIALVHDRSLCDYDGIEYIELPDTIRSWGRRLWCEYVTMQGISRELASGWTRRYLCSHFSRDMHTRSMFALTNGS